MKHFINLLLLISLTANSQTEFNSKDLNVTLGDLQTTVYEKDSTAIALVIYEKGNSYIDKQTFRLKTEIEKKIKILKKEGEEYANVEIRLYNDKKSRVEKIAKIKATSYNLNNNHIEKTFLIDENIFREKYDENNTLIKFTLPKIKPGTVITYSYTLESPYISKYYGWDFQDYIPKLYSEYHASIPGNYDYSIRLVGGQKLIKNESTILKDCLFGNNGAKAHCSFTQYAMKDIPAFIEEDFMTSEKNYLIRIEYDLKTIKYFDGTIDKVTKTWKDVDKELRSFPSLGRQLKKGHLVKDLLPPNILSESNKLEQAKLIYNLVQEQYSWNGKGLRLRKSPLKELIENKSGNVSQINLLLHNLLIENEIDSKPVLVSTRDNGYPTKLFPVLFDFNYLIVQAKIEGKTYLLDATDKYLVFGQLPLRSLNLYGRLLDFKKGSSWIDIKNNKFSSSIHQINIRFDEIDEISGEIKSRFTNYNALNKKKDYYSDSDSYIENFENKYPFLEVIDHEVQTNELNDINFQESYKISYSELESIGNLIYFNPFIYSFISSNPFKLQERTYPIDFGYKRAYMYSFELDLNNLYEVESLPEKRALKLPEDGGLCYFSISSKEKKIKISFRVQLKRSLYPSEYYDLLKKLASNIVDIQSNSLIVLKKK